MSNDQRPVEILLIEDSPADVRLTQEALKEATLAYRLHTVGDGDAALHFLRREEGYLNSPKPDIILLDFNLPKRDGRQVLVDLKEDPQFRSIPVIVLTTSRAESDVKAAYDLHANCYIQKPVDLNHFLQIVQSIEKFWLNVATLPKISQSL